MFLKKLFGMSATETVGGKVLGGVLGGVAGVVATTVARCAIEEMLKPDVEPPVQNLSDPIVFMTRAERAAYMERNEGPNYKEV